MSKIIEPAFSSADLSKPLRGWVNPLPMWVREAILDGRLNVIEFKGVQLLKGTVTNSQGTIVSFL